MESVPPRGSGWVCVEIAGLTIPGPTRYREVVLTPSVRKFVAHVPTRYREEVLTS